MPGYESFIEQQIRQAQERGDFDDLPGLGKPLPNRNELEDEMWWVKDYLRREGLSTEALLPRSLQLAREVERLPETVRGLRSEDTVRRVVTDLNTQIIAYLRAPSGPLVPLRTVNPDEVVAEWRAAQPPPPPAPAFPSPSSSPSPSPSPSASPPRRRRWWPARKART